MYHLNYELGIVHRDCRSENIYLNLDTNKYEKVSITAYVGEFGFSVSDKTDEDLKQVFNFGKLPWLVVF